MEKGGGKEQRILKRVHLMHVLKETPVGRNLGRKNGVCPKDLEAAPNGPGNSQEESFRRMQLRLILVPLREVRPKTV